RAAVVSRPAAQARHSAAGAGVALACRRTGRERRTDPVRLRTAALVPTLGVEDGDIVDVHARAIRQHGPVAVDAEQESNGLAVEGRQISRHLLPREALVVQVEYRRENRSGGVLDEYLLRVEGELVVRLPPVPEAQLGRACGGHGDILVHERAADRVAGAGDR